MSSLLPRRALGATGLSVSIVGLGGGALGDPTLGEREAAALLDEALALGVNLIDSARSYGESEARIGRHLARRRDELVLSTKVGYGIPGHEDWTGSCVRAGIDAALGRLATDHIDLVHLHSCPASTLARGEVIQALQDAVRAGKVRAAAYSGDGEDAEAALATGAFASVQTSLNLCDQRAAARVLPAAAERAMGVIAKRPAANAPWRFFVRPTGDEAEEYWVRWRELHLDPPAGGEGGWQELALRFAAWFPGVHAILVGTRDRAHLRANVAMAARGPLPDDVTAAIRRAFAERGAHWRARV